MLNYFEGKSSSMNGAKKIEKTKAREEMHVELFIVE